MKEINIAKTIVTKRKEKGITQLDLAGYMGVSKASVSKWETGQSYPDIVLLPQLATYFNISIDDLLGYSPQMTKEGIRQLYHRLSLKFSTNPFEEVLEESRSIIKKYYACFPLLLQMVILLVNHHMLAKEEDTRTQVLQEAIELCVRIKTEGQDVWLSKQANALEAMCYMTLQQPDEVLELLEGTIKPFTGDEVTLATAYQMTGNISKAKEVIQISLYQQVLSVLGMCASYMMLQVQEPEKFEDTLQRALAIILVFNVKQLNPNVAVQVYIAAAQVYAIQEKTERALEMLKEYSDICIKYFFPIVLRGDEFFDSIQSWFDDFDLGSKGVRNEKVVVESMIQVLTANPVFDQLQLLPEFTNLINKMKINLGGK